MNIKGKMQYKDKVMVDIEVSDRKLDRHGRASDILEQQEFYGPENDGFDFLVHSIDPYSIKNFHKNDVNL